MTLVAVEAELEEQRERRQAERRAWQAERQRLVAETARSRAEDQVQLEAERQNRLQEQALHHRAACEAERLQEKVNRLRRHGARTRQQRDEALRQVEGLEEKLERLNEHCARLSAYLDEAETENRVSRETHQAETRRLREALDEALAEAESTLQRESAHIAQIHALESQRGEPRQEDRVAQ